MDKIEVTNLPHVQSPYLTEDFTMKGSEEPGSQASMALSHLMKVLFAARLCRPDLLIGIRRLESPLESKTRTHNGRVGLVGTAHGGQRGGATLGRTRCRHFGGLGSQAPLWPSSAMLTTVLNVSSQARTKVILCKPLKEQNVRLTRGLAAVYHRFINGTASALRCWLLTSVPTLICFCKPFSCKACPGKNELLADLP